MANDIDRAFVRMLESHRDVPTETAMASIRDPSFEVLRLNEDLPFFAQLRTVLCSTPEVCARDPYVDTGQAVITSSWTNEAATLVLG